MGELEHGESMAFADENCAPDGRQDGLLAGTRHFVIGLRRASGKRDDADLDPLVGPTRSRAVAADANPAGDMAVDDVGSCGWDDRRGDAACGRPRTEPRV